MASPAILLTGATGYVGARLLSALERDGVAVRCLARRPEAVLPGATTTAVVRGDTLDRASVRDALAGIRVAYYLVHAMGSGGSFEEADRESATIFGQEAARAGVARVIYLGGLGGGDQLSGHLRSRQETGAILARHVSTTEFRAGIVIGAGSLSFEAIATLVRRLPVMVAPRWVATRTQPIGIDDVVAYLLAARDLDVPPGIYEIGGPDVVTYEGLMMECARQLGLRRRIIGVPVLTPRLSSLWLGLVTPVYARVARKMIDGLRNETVVTNASALTVFGSIAPQPMRVALATALAEGAVPSLPRSDRRPSADPRAAVAADASARFVDARCRHVRVEPGQAFVPIQRIGGRAGWYAFDWLWTLRGAIDRLVGGVGTRRGRRHPEVVAVGDTLDFWRVERFEQDRVLRLRAEMRVPGRAWLQFDVVPEANGSRICQTAVFEPNGLAGRAYWFALSPIHHLLFRTMLRNIATRAEGAVDASRGEVGPRRS